MSAYFFSLYSYFMYAVKLWLAFGVFTFVMQRREDFLRRSLATMLPFAAMLFAVAFIPSREDYAMAAYTAATIYLFLHIAVCYKGSVLDYIFYGMSACFLSASLSMFRQAFLYLRYYGEPLSLWVVPDGWLDVIVTIVLMVALYGCCSLLFTRKIPKHGDTGLSLVYLGFIGVDIVISVVFSLFAEPVRSYSTLLGIVYSLAMGLVYVLLLYMQYTILFKQKYERDKIVQEQQNIAIEAVSKEAYRQYRALKANMDTINIKCHDLKHQLNALSNLDSREVEEIVSAVAFYDSAADTGNPVLDTILTGTAMRCAAEKIRFTHVADGRLISFMSEMDTCALFGNILENAIEYVRTLEEDKRFIRLWLSQRGEMAVISCENYFEGTLEQRDGLPVTHKEDKLNHGFGIKSIMRTAEKYGGYARVETNGNSFTVTAIMRIR